MLEEEKKGPSRRGRRGHHKGGKGVTKKKGDSSFLSRTGAKISPPMGG